MTIRSVATSTQLPAAWDDLATSVYTTREWLATVESRGPVEYMIAGGDTLTAGAAVYVIDASVAPSPYLRLDALLERLTGVPHASEDHLPALLVGSREFGIDGFLRRDRSSRYAEGAAELLAAVRDRARRDRYRAVYLPAVADEDAVLLTVLAEQGFRRFQTDATLAVPVVGLGVSAYLTSLPGKLRRNAQREIRALQEVRFETAPLNEGMLDELVDLEQANLVRHGSTRDRAATRRMFETYLSLSGASTRVFLARGEDRALGFSLFVVWRTTAYGRNIGLDYNALGGRPLYFALTVYEPVGEFARHGVASLDLGPSGDDAKLRRGAVPSARSCHVLRLP